jgi:uncharacterized protein
MRLRAFRPSRNWETIGPVSRYLYFSLGCVMVGLGVIGAILPLMPTTIFLILAAGCFARSSPACEQWLLDHPRFGASLRGWREEGAISVPAKCMACLGMSVGVLLFYVGAHPSIWLSVGVAAVMLASAAYVVSRPHPGLGRRVGQSGQQG